jgi:2-dehydropantoate 2-reductase
MPSGRIHILGVGNIARLFAHAIATKHLPPPITLLLHHPSLQQEWIDAKKTIKITTDGVTRKGGSYDTEIIKAPSSLELPGSRREEENIENLIITTKTINTADAISSIRHRLNEHSTLLFTQNGMGTVEEVVHKFFENISTRPKILASVTSHGIYSTGPFQSVHAGLGTVTIGAVYANSDGEAIEYPMMTQILNAPILASRAVDSHTLRLVQLEKLIINAMINPLTVIFDRRNGLLLENAHIVELRRRLLIEASQVLLSLPEVKGDANARELFSNNHLTNVVVGVNKKTAQNMSSMLQDFRAGRPTEIDYINGYIVRRGIETGVRCRNHESLIGLVKNRQVIRPEDIDLFFHDL